MVPQQILLQLQGRSDRSEEWTMDTIENWQKMGGRSKNQLGEDFTRWGPRKRQEEDQPSYQ